MSIHKPLQYAAFFWAENKVTHPDYEYIIHLAEPRCFIKFPVELAMFSTFDEFFNSIAEVQWIDGAETAPSGRDLEEFLTTAWNYLCLEERILDDDLRNMEDDDF